MSQTPNIQVSNNAAILDGGVFGAVIYGDQTPVQIVGSVTISGNSSVIGNLSVTGTISGPISASGPSTLTSYLKASLPAATVAGQTIYVSDATGAHVTGSLCFSNGTGNTHWIDVTTGFAVV